MGRKLFLIGAAMPASETSPATAVERALNILEAAAQRREGLTQRGNQPQARNPQEFRELHPPNARETRLLAA